MSTSTSLRLRTADLERSITILRSMKQNLSVNLDLRHIEGAKTHSFHLLEEELQLKQRELEEVRAGLKK